MPRQLLTQKQFCAYAKSRLGYGSKTNVKLEELVCWALVIDKRPKPPELTNKAWVDKNIGYIEEQVIRLKVGADDSSVPGRLNPLYRPPLSGNPGQIKRQRKRDAKKLRKIVINDPTVQSIIDRRVRTIVAQKTKQQAEQPPAQPTFQPYPVYQPQMGKAFYQTREWRELRYKVLTKYGKTCQCCGETSGYIHVDHIKPRSLFPDLELDISNLQVLCEACNIGKSNQDTTDWRR
jgi:hypothetical protein